MTTGTTQAGRPGGIGTAKSTSAAPAPIPGPDDIQLSTNETRDRIITGIVTVLPFVGLGIAMWQAWSGLLHGHDLIVFAIFYLVSTAGITVGFHRLLTHRSFKTKPWVKALFAIFGSIAIEGPVISWVADHRKHHAFADKPGDPHSPHVDHGHGWSGALKGLFHAHLGWIFIHTQRGKHERYAPDLLDDPVVSTVNRTFLVWALGGLAGAFFLGWLIGGTVVAGLTGLLWGGAVRMLFVHHVTYSINSLCHFFGKRRFDTPDQSTNLHILGLLAFGEGYHNNHHAFPTSARHGLRRWDIDPSAWLIWGMERVGLAWDVVRISPERQAAKAAA